MVKTLLVKLKNVYVQFAWILIKKKQNSNQNVKVEKMVVFVKTFVHNHLMFNFDFVKLFQLSSKTISEFETEI